MGNLDEICMIEHLIDFIYFRRRNYLVWKYFWWHYCCWEQNQFKNVNSNEATMAWREKTPTMTILAVWLFDNNAESRCSNRIVGFKITNKIQTTIDRVGILKGRQLLKTTKSTPICPPGLSPCEKERFTDHPTALLKTLPSIWPRKRLWKWMQLQR